MQRVSVMVDIDWDIFETIERLAESSRRTTIEELQYIIGQAAVGQPVDPRPGVRKIGMVRYIRNRMEALDQ